jgi:hypothetical protein
MDDQRIQQAQALDFVHHVLAVDPGLYGENTRGLAKAFLVLTEQQPERAAAAQISEAITIAGDQIGKIRAEFVKSLVSTQQVMVAQQPEPVGRDELAGVVTAAHRNWEEHDLYGHVDDYITECIQERFVVTRKAGV